MNDTQAHPRANKIARVTCAALLAGSLVALPLSPAALAKATIPIDFTDIACIDDEAQTLYTSQNGLPVTVATAIAQTSEGFIWIGSYEGLTRFDGQVFEAQDAVLNFSVASLLAADDGSLWIGTSNHGLYRYANGTSTQIEAGDGGFSEVLCLAKAADGSIVMGTEHGIFAVDAGGQASKVAAEGLSEGLVRGVAASGTGTIMAVTQDSCLFSIENGRASKLSLAGVTGAPRCVTYDTATERFYVGTDKSDVCALSAKGAQTGLFKIEGAVCINDVDVSDKGVMWVCSDNGIYSYHDKKTSRQHLQMDNSVDSMLVDAEGNHWFASSRQGVLLVANTAFEDVSSYVGMPQAVVNAIVKYRGKLIVGTDDRACSVDLKANGTKAGPNLGALDGLRVRDLKVDSKGRLWAATTKGGVLCMDKSGKWTSYTSQNSKAISSDDFRCLYEAGSSMIAGGDEGAVIIDKTGVHDTVNDPEGLGVRVMSVSKLGDTLLLGTDGYGLQIVQDGAVVGNITSKDGLPSDSIMKIYPCSDKKTLVLVTGSGLVKMTQNRDAATEHYSADSFVVSSIETIPVSNTLDAIWQDDGTVWVATGRGIYRTSESALLNDESGSCKLYTRKDGLPYDITANSRQLVDEGILYLSGTGGVGAIDLKEAAEESGSCELSVSGAYVDGKMIPASEDGSIAIPANAERIKIMAHACTYNKTNITLYYVLGGYDSHLNTTPLEDFSGLEYTNVRGGTYQLSFGVWDKAEEKPLNTAEVTVKKEYSLSDHPLTRVGVVAVVLVLIGLGFAWRRRKLREQLQEEYEEKERRTLEKMAYSDFLTEAYNRNYLRVWEQNAHEGAYKLPASLVAIDLNNLKTINDTAGHSAGDRYLRCTINALLDAFGAESTSIVRLGGDEFLVIAEGIGEDEAKRRIAHACELLSKVSVDGQEYSFCYGTASIENADFSLDERLRSADKVLVAEKRRYHETHDRRRA